MHELKNFIYIKSPFANIVVWCEEISVPCLKNQHAIFTGSLYVKKKSVVEWCTSIFTPIMSISLLFFLVVNICLYEHIRGALYVFDWHILCVENWNSNLIVAQWFSFEIPNLLIFRIFCNFLNFNPHRNHTLTQWGAVVVELSKLNRLMFKLLPSRVKKSVI